MTKPKQPRIYKMRRYIVDRRSELGLSQSRIAELIGIKNQFEISVFYDDSIIEDTKQKIDSSNNVVGGEVDEYAKLTNSLILDNLETDYISHYQKSVYKWPSFHNFTKNNRDSKPPYCPELILLSNESTSNISCFSFFHKSSRTPIFTDKN